MRWREAGEAYGDQVLAPKMSKALYQNALYGPGLGESVQRGDHHVEATVGRVMQCQLLLFLTQDNLDVHFVL